MKGWREPVRSKSVVGESPCPRCFLRSPEPPAVQGRIRIGIEAHRFDAY